MGIHSTAGSWIVEYIVFVLFSVSEGFDEEKEGVLMQDRYFLLHVQVFWFTNSRHMRDRAVFPRLRQFWEGL